MPNVVRLVSANILEITGLCFGSKATLKVVTERIPVLLANVVGLNQESAFKLL
jgi:hypothetical protein